ncbi:MAG: hypothetical protein V3V72_04610 [Ignavibacteriaceae bacterium]
MQIIIDVYYTKSESVYPLIIHAGNHANTLFHLLLFSGKSPVDRYLFKVQNFVVMEHELLT